MILDSLNTFLLGQHLYALSLMDMTQNDIIQTIEQIAPLTIASSWDHSGVQLASTRKLCQHIAVSLDPTVEILQQAIELGADFLLTHHPLSMTPRFLSTLDTYTAFVRLAFKHDIPVYAAHTSLDANPLGPVAWLADALSLTNRTLLEPTAQHILNGKNIDCGLGLVGDLPIPLSFKALRDILYTYMPDNTRANVSHIPQKPIQRLAICPGSGSSFMHEAANAGADIFITGDVKYHTALEAPLPLIDLGHFVLEEIMMQHFTTMLSNAMPSIHVTLLPAKNPLQIL